MHQFIVTGHDAPTTPDFSLDDITGRAGRFDILCHCISSTSFFSHDIREDVRVHLILGDEYAVHFESSELHRLNPDGHSTAALIRKALEKREETVSHMLAKSSSSVSIRRVDFETMLEEAASNATMAELHGDGDPAVQVEPPGNPLFISSGHHGFTDGEAELLVAVTGERVRLGSEILHADHSIAIAHNYLDTTGYSRY